VALQPGDGGRSPAILIAIVGSFAFALTVLSRALASRHARLRGRLLADARCAGRRDRSGPPRPGPPFAPDLALLCFLGIVAIGAHLAIARSLKLAEAATVAPLHCTIIVWAIIFDWFAFGDVPTTNIMLGAAIIVAADLTIWFRDTRVARTRRARRVNASLGFHTS
jgi:hypothetical protein